MNLFRTVVWVIIINCFLSCQHSGKDYSDSKKVVINLPKKVEELENLTVISDQKAPLFDISFKKVGTFGSTENILFYYVGNFSVDNENRVYIADKNDIKLFQADGAFIKTLGRKGRGPGEFNNFGALSPKVFDSGMYVYDEVLSRINVFNFDSLEFSHSIAINPKNWQHIEELNGLSVKKLFEMNTKNLLVGFKTNNPDVTDPYFIFYLMNHEGNIISQKIIKYKSPQFYDGIGTSAPKVFFDDRGLLNPSTRSHKIDIDSKDNIYLLWTDLFLIKVYDSQGRYKRALYYPSKNTPLNGVDIIDSYQTKYLKQKAKSINFPETWPVVNHFFIDDEDRIWVSTIIDDDNNYEWYILSNDGELVARFKWKGERLKRDRKERQIRTVKNNHLYTKETDNETFEVKVVKYKIVFHENS